MSRCERGGGNSGVVVMVHNVAREMAAIQGAQEQMNAARRLHAQAEQRIALGRQLFKAAEAHLANQQNLLAQVRAEQDALAQRMQADVARSLHEYDQWVGKQQQEVDERLQEMEQRLAEMIEQWQSVEQRVESFVRRAEALLDQGRHLLAGPGAAGAGPVSGGAGERDNGPIYSELMKGLPSN